MSLSPAILTFGLLMLAAVGAAQADPIQGVPVAGPGERFEFVSRQMGTLFRIVLYAPDADTAAAAASAAFARVTELNRLMSDYEPQSELRRLERPPAGTAVPVSADLFDILERSQQLAAQSNGAFDVTLGPLVRLWRDARKNRQLPEQVAQDAARRASGFAQLRLQPESRTVTRLAPGMQFDLGGIAKGYAADEALAVLARRGRVHAMVAASGDLALGAAPPGTAGWKIELTPFGEPAPEPAIVVAEHVGISTSGDAEQFVEIGGVRYSHIVDPATGLGLTARVAVTVIARNATRSDSLATACSVLAGGQPAKLAACLGDSARALVRWREDGGRLRRETYGTNPPGLKSNL